MKAFPQGGIGLAGELQYVAAVAPDCGFFRQHNGEAGAAGEAGEPGQALGTGGDVFAQVLVAAGDEEAGQALCSQFRSYGGQAFFVSQSESHRNLLK